MFGTPIKTAEFNVNGFDELIGKMKRGCVLNAVKETC